MNSNKIALTDESGFQVVMGKNSKRTLKSRVQKMLQSNDKMTSLQAASVRDIMALSIADR